MTIFTAFDTLLRERRASRPLLLFIGSLVLFAAYGAAAGAFQGGAQIAVALLKIPLVILASVLLCVPSFYVFTTLGGAEYTRETFWSALCGFFGIAALILIALMPVVWLFSASTLSLGFVVWMHIYAWLAALVFGRQYLVRTTPARFGIGLWITIVFLVSLQMTTYLRPILWRSPGRPLFESEKKSFFTHLRDVNEWAPPKPGAVTPTRGVAAAREPRR